MYKKMRILLAFLLCAALVTGSTTLVSAKYKEIPWEPPEPGIFQSSDGSSYIITEDGEAYELGKVIAVIDRDTVSRREFTAEDFPGIEIESIEADDWWWWLSIRLVSQEPEAVLEAVEVLKANPLVKDAFENGLTFLDDPTVIIIGDVDGDYEVTARDALIILQHIVGLSTLEDTELADMDENGEITAEDVSYVLQEAVGLTPDY